MDESSGLCGSAHSDEQDEVKGKEQEVAEADSQHCTLASTGVFIGPIRGIALAQLWDVLQCLMGVVPQKPRGYCCDGKPNQIDVFCNMGSNFQRQPYGSHVPC